MMKSDEDVIIYAKKNQQMKRDQLYLILNEMNYLFPQFYHRVISKWWFSSGFALFLVCQLFTNFIRHKQMDDSTW